MRLCAQVHAIIQCIRAVFDEVFPDMLLVTETNVPHKDNISYFGNGYNEAQMVYNFTLPPLTFFSFVQGMGWHGLQTVPHEALLSPLATSWASQVFSIVMPDMRREPVACIPCTD